MNFESFLGGTLITGAAIGLVAAFWSKLKALAWRAASLFVVRITLEGAAADALSLYLWQRGKRSRFGERAYHGVSLYVRPVDRRLAVAFEKVGRDAAVFWLGNRPLVAVQSSVVQGQTFLGTTLTVTFVRGLFDADGLVRTAVDEYNDRAHGNGRKRFAITRCVGSGTRGRGRDDGSVVGGLGASSGDHSLPAPDTINDNDGRRYLRWRDDEIGQPTPDDPLGPLAFPPSVESLYVEARQWLASEAWYKARRIQWRRGWLLYGLPGTGKSSFAKAVAQDLDLPVFVMELATLSDGELIKLWRDAMARTPCMILLEDLHTVFKGQENRLGERGGNLSFGCLLNCVSGVEGADGAILVVTTNRLEDVDPALGVPDGSGQSTRPGRVDRAVEMGPLDEDCRRRVAVRILADCPGEVERLVAAGAGDTGAQFQNKCCEVALKRHWDSRAVADGSAEVRAG